MAIFPETYDMHRLARIAAAQGRFTVYRGAGGKWPGHDRTGQVDKRKQRRRLRLLARRALPGCAAGYLKNARYHRR